MLDESIGKECKLKEHYVYELVDENGDAFYVGKGTGERAFHHGKEAGSSNVDSEKLNKIRTVGNNVRVIGRYKTREEAFAVESTLIHWIYGIDNLVNIQSGHGSDTIRPKGKLDEIEGIDIPKRIRSFDGTYTREREAEREKNKIIPYMEEVKKSLENDLHIELDDLNINNPKWTTISYTIYRIKIIVGTANSSTKGTLFVLIEPINGSSENLDIIKQICTESTFECKNNGKYARLDSFKSTSDLEEIKKVFTQYLEILSQTFKKLVKNNERSNTKRDFEIMESIINQT